MRSARTLLFLAVLLAAGVVVWMQAGRKSREAAPGTPAPVQRQNMLDAGLLSERGGALTPAGTVWRWELRMDKEGADRLVNVEELAGIAGVVGFSFGGCSVLALKADGSVWGRGCTAAGQLGPMTMDDRGVITDWTRAEGLPKIRQVLATGVTALALAHDGTVWAWGSNHHGMMGRKTAGYPQRTPVRLAALNGIAGIAAGGGGAMGAGDAYYAVKNDGTVWVWGRRYLFGLPHSPGAPEFIDHDEPVQIEGLANVRRIVIDRAAGSPALAIHADGSVTLWGLQLVSCHGRTDAVVALPGLSDVASAAIGAGDVVAVRTDGSLWHWGWTEATPDRSARCMDTAARLLPPGSAAEVAATGPAYFMLGSDGAVQAWGLRRGPHQLTRFAERSRIEKLPHLQPAREGRR